MLAFIIAETFWPKLDCWCVCLLQRGLEGTALVSLVAFRAMWGLFAKGEH